MSDAALKFMSWKRIGQNLNRIRRSVFPPCPDINTLIEAFETNVQVQDTFAFYRGDNFYRDSIIIGDQTIMVFAIQQLLDELEPGCALFCDGTFGIVPLKFRQMFVVMAEIEGEFIFNS